MALAQERAFADLIRDAYQPVDRRRTSSALSYDFDRRDGRAVLDLRVSVLGTRDLEAAVMHLARIAASRPELERATLVAVLPRMSPDRIAREWRGALDVLRPDARRRLALVAIASDRDILVPVEDPELRRLASLARDALRPSGEQGSPTFARSAWSAKDFAVCMVLLDAWLRGEGALAIGSIVKRSGASHPTVRRTLARLHERDELRRSTDRSAGFIVFPRRSMGELLVLADSFRETRRFVDRSGRPPDVASLLRRILAKAPADVAVGGVEGARHYTPDFDLHGLPRIDVTVGGRSTLEWITRVDPALGEASPQGSAPVLVVHRSLRSDPRAESVSRQRLPFASPAEVLFDLYDLRLTSQADEFIHTLQRQRPER